jgi:hypothetical protein
VTGPTIRVDLSDDALVVTYDPDDPPAAEGEMR